MKTHPCPPLRLLELPAIRTFLLLLALASSASVARAQPSTLTILEKHDGATLGSDACDEDKAVSNGYYKTQFGDPCCGSPGQRQCQRSNGKASPTYSCLSGYTFRQDPYDGNYYCNPAPPGPESTNLLPAARPTGGTDFTFYVTSDMHFYRNIYDLEMQTRHPDNINQFSKAGYVWPVGTGTPSIVIPPPTAIIVPGDLGMCIGGADELGGYRLAWERNSHSGSIEFPVYFGLGNHDITTGGSGCGDMDMAKRIWGYLDERTANMHSDRNATGCLIGVDPGCADQGSAAGSHNYSWDWHGVHMVMLNTWAGERDRELAIQSSGLVWLANDLNHYVGSSNRPVVLFQHYTLGDIAADGNYGGAKYWLQSDYHSFWNIVRKYNIVGMFSGHTHDLGFEQPRNQWSSDQHFIDLNGEVYYYYGVAPADAPSPTADKLASVTHGWDTPFMDNYIDGNAGSCGSDLCSGNHTGKANFLAVRVTDHYMDVTAVSELEGGITALGDTGMNFVNNAKSCRKRINSPYSLWNGSVQHDTGSLFHYTNSTGGVLQGPLAVTYSNLSVPNFVDTCAGGSAFRMILDDGETLQPGASVIFHLYEVPDPSAVSMYLLRDSVTAAFTATGLPVTGFDVGKDTVGISVATHLGDTGPFTVVQNVNWLKITVDKTTFPGHFNVSAVNPPANASTSIYVLPNDPTLPLLTIGVSVGNLPITITSNPVGATIYVDKTAYTTPSTFNWTPGDQHLIDASRPSTTAGVNQHFVSWSSSHPATFNYIVPIQSESLTATFTMSYLLTLQTPQNGTLTVTPTNPEGYASNTSVKVTATPATGYYFSGFGGDITAKTSPSTLIMTKPMTVSATFIADPVATIGVSPVTAAQVTVDNVNLPAPAQVQWVPATSHSVAFNPQSPSTGWQLLFSKWSDLNTQNPRSFTGGTADQSLTIDVTSQAYLKVTANPPAGGTIAGASWSTVGTQATLTATPAGGYAFSSFSGDLIAATSPQALIVQGPMNIVANFVPAQPQIGGNLAITDDSSPSVVRLGLTISNTGQGAASQVQTSVTVKVSTGTGTVSVKNNLPLLFHDLQPGASSPPQELDVNWPTTASRVQLILTYSAENGAYQTTQTFNFFR